MFRLITASSSMSSPPLPSLYVCDDCHKSFFRKPKYVVDWPNKRNGQYYTYMYDERNTCWLQDSWSRRYLNARASIRLGWGSGICNWSGIAATQLAHDGRMRIANSTLSQCSQLQNCTLSHAWTWPTQGWRGARHQSPIVFLNLSKQVQWGPTLGSAELPQNALVATWLVRHNAYPLQENDIIIVL